MCRTITSASSLCLRLLIVVVILVGMVGFSGEATAATGTCPAWAAKVVSIDGQVEAMPAGETQWRTVALNDTFCPDDQIRTLKNSRAALQLSNETILRLDQNTLVKLSANKPESPSLLKIFTGRALFMTRFPHPLTIETPYVNASSGGTEYVIEVDKEHQTSTLTVIEGTMHLKNDKGTLTITDGQSSVTHAGEEPVSRVVVNAKDTLHWALYYPPVLNIHDLNLGLTVGVPDTDWRAMVKKSITAYEADDLKKAFAEISHAPTNIDDSRFYAYQASLLLAVGRVKQAQTDIEQSLKLAANNGLALSLQSIIAVVQNHPDKALSLAQDAATAAPDSAGVRIALSYAWQSNFNLAQALTAAQDATRLDPKSALAWARTAELWLSQGYLADSLEAAKRAESLNPREARVQTILGFAYLTQIKVKQAQAAFEQAITLISSDPLPRLGLGLAKIRQGKLHNGRKDIEIAAALDPGNALIRSYLGKAYYEEKRNDKSAIQFNLAEQLDPNDPTPYSYDAVLKQTTNRPVEALNDIQSAITLNDNRAVYRSRLLLDSDLASRSVSRGRTYQTMGFDQLAVIDALQSVNTDPMNYSAQRFLADSYAALPHSEIARQSALLVSELLQPVNNNPVQPSLSNDSLLRTDSNAPSAAFNEYSQLFDSNGTRLLASGVAGQEDTLGDELVVSGVQSLFSWSLGQFHYNTDGFRDNAGIDQKIYNIYMQGQVTPKLGIQGEARLNQVDNGYLSIHYDPSIYSPTYNKDQTNRTYRLGAHYAPTPSSDVLLSTIYQHQDEQQIDPGIWSPNAKSSEIAHQRNRLYEAQYLTKIARASIIAGTGYYSGDNNDAARVSVVIPGLGTVVKQVNVEAKTHHTNAYLYALYALTKEIQLSLGGSYDRLRDDRLGNDNHFNPKLGVLWDVGTSTSLRLVGLKSYSRDIVSNQTIEPTQVAGFQQFFDDSPGSDSNLYGIGLDHRFSRKASSGIEFTKRDVTSPFIDASSGTPIVVKDKYRMQAGRAYYYRAITDRITTSVDYYYDRTKIDKYGINIDTQRVPVGIKLFYPNGFFAGLTGSYIDQNGDVIDPISGAVVSTSSHFCIMDASIGYRLPKRRGIVSIEIRNLTDRQFRLHQSSPASDDPNEVPLLVPERFVSAKITLAFD